MVQIFWISTGKLKCIPVYNYGDLRNLALPIPIRPYRLSPQHKDCLRLVGSDNEICTQCYSHINNRCVFTEPCSTSRTLVALDILYSGEFSWVLIFAFQCQETTPTNSEYRCVGVYSRFNFLVNCSAPKNAKCYTSRKFPVIRYMTIQTHILLTTAFFVTLAINRKCDYFHWWPCIVIKGAFPFIAHNCSYHCIRCCPHRHHWRVTNQTWVAQHPPSR